MCGIAGIYNTSKSNEELEHLAKKFVNLLHHRGPDGNGFKILHHTNEKKTLLTHTRLSIIDLSDLAKQPMSKYNEKISISYNGEIYNYKELRSELIRDGEKFTSDSDTEVVIAAYKKWGINCFEKFIGMWALAIFDRENNSVLLSRDRLGIKPLYYAKDKSSIIFGSEAKIILGYSSIFCEANEDSISDYLSYRYPLGKKTFFKNINCIEQELLKFLQKIMKLQKRIGILIKTKNMILIVLK